RMSGRKKGPGRSAERGRSSRALPGSSPGTTAVAAPRRSGPAAFEQEQAVPSTRTADRACLVCGAAVEAFLNFGPMPIANGFLTREEIPRERFFDLEVGACPRCGMVQLTRRIDPSELFHGNYAYFSSLSSRMTEHFRRFAGDVRGAWLTG